MINNCLSAENQVELEHCDIEESDMTVIINSNLQEVDMDFGNSSESEIDFPCAQKTSEYQIFLRFYWDIVNALNEECTELDATAISTFTQLGADLVKQNHFAAPDIELKLEEIAKSIQSGSLQVDENAAVGGNIQILQIGDIISFPQGDGVELLNDINCEV